MNWKMTLASLGAVIGPVQGAYALIVAYTSVPSTPSVLEVLVQLVVVVMLALMYGVIGFVIALLLSNVFRGG
jgi:hypothetical protein